MIQSEHDDTHTTDPTQLNSNGGLHCPLSARSVGIDALTSDKCHGLADAGCPLAAEVHHRLQFETLLTELSAKFVNVPASQVDSQIEWGLRRIVELLGIDRSGLGQVSADRRQLVVQKIEIRQFLTHLLQQVVRAVNRR